MSRNVVDTDLDQESATNRTQEEDTSQSPETGRTPEAATISQDLEIGTIEDQLHEAETKGKRKCNLRRHKDVTDAIDQVTYDDHV